MKIFLFVPMLLLALLTLPGCGSGSEATVNPAPEITDEEFLEMDAESDRARQEALREES
ncbi:hypothetical protein [Allorhodopirellula solitaria]|uniref:Secreted protein n=1 Tax=Allorhodopirellula solitaria TaxID=2527987 RepID=A0A5C5YHI9_9BACT|nr:hypothetical protein [Allorhodopirellula solitaria]TWT74241.1 hypothetical protein CA85_11280 [Allorhodopirellula solitaria]